MTKASKIGSIWLAEYRNRDGDWRVARDARGRTLKCETRTLALSVAAYRRRRLEPLAQ